MDEVMVYGTNGKSACVPKYLVENWLKARDQLAKRGHGVQRARNAKLYLDNAAGFRVFTIGQVEVEA